MAQKEHKYCRDLKQYHVLTSTLIFLSLVIIIFSTDNPMIIGSAYIFIVSAALSAGEKNMLVKGFMYFIPIAVLIVAINVIFVSSGHTVLFYLLGKSITLESMIYGVVMAVKFLAVIYVFMILQIMIDSDRAVSYFCSIMPKSTLMMMIGFKLIPSMRQRFINLKEVYEVRGVVFDRKRSKERAKSYVPVLSILLEDSMESSFIIGEAAYVRGFLSSGRSVYERQKFYFRDYIVILLCMLMIIFYCAAQFIGLVRFNIYDGVTIIDILNIGTTVIFTLIVLISYMVIFNSREIEYGVH